MVDFMLDQNQRLMDTLALEIDRLEYLIKVCRFKLHQAYKRNVFLLFFVFSSSAFLTVQVTNV